LIYFVFESFSENLFLQLFPTNDEGLYKCERSAVEGFSKSTKSKVDINPHNKKISTNTMQTSHLNNTLCKQNTQTNVCSHNSVTFQSQFLMFILTAILTSLISAIATCFACKKMQKDSSEAKRIADRVDWKMLNQLDTDLNCSCIGVPTPMQPIEPKIFQTNSSTCDSHMYENMQNQFDKKDYKLKYITNNETGTFI
jgi:hypothetical protein